LPALAERRAGLAVAALLALAAGSWAWAASAEGPGKLITQPVWIKKPTAADFQRVYPLRGAANHATVKAVITCGIAGDGTLRDCKPGVVRTESDTLHEPGDTASVNTALLEMSKLFQMAPTSRDGVRTAGGTIRIPMMWVWPTGLN
ncbi:MAG TPA: hypothetical protein VHV27_10220, partial [Phenylobacterium sp.]|nr:hypothetical protein [Phenylobacterium sp.]